MRRRRRRKELSLTKIIVLFVVCTLTFSVGYSLLSQQLSVEGTVNLLYEKELTCKEYVTDELKLTYDNKMLWHNAGLNYMQIDITLTNLTQEEMTDWKVMIKFISDIEISGSWAGNYTESDNKVTITGLDWNKTLAPGGQTTFGFQVSTPDEEIHLSSIYLNGDLAIPGESCSNVSDGDNTGGDNTGGDNTGGDNTGGDNTGGDNTGGDNTGGDNTGGDNTGGDNTGGDNTGGDNTGGDNTGGDNTGGDNTGGDNTGGDNTGGDNTGGDNTGGDNTGGGTFTPEITSSNVDVKVTNTTSWGTEGNYTYQYDITVTNNSDVNIDGWSFQFEIPDGASMGDYWQCEYINADGVVTILSNTNTAKLEVGQSAQIGFHIKVPTNTYVLKVR
ncbi:MAG: hypothetical protein E7157_04710 [Lactobacillales bacterium]|nr:hypothetical protein [Lactobacillales bacterium]